MNSVDYDLLELNLHNLRQLYKKYKLEFETAHPSTMRRPALIRTIMTYRRLIEIHKNIPTIPITTQLAPRSIPVEMETLEDLELNVPGVPLPRIKSVQ